MTLKLNLQENQAAIDALNLYSQFLAGNFDFINALTYLHWERLLELRKRYLLAMEARKLQAQFATFDPRSNEALLLHFIFSDAQARINHTDEMIVYSDLTTTQIELIAEAVDFTADTVYAYLRNWEQYLKLTDAEQINECRYIITTILKICLLDETVPDGYGHCRAVNLQSLRQKL